MCGSLWHVPLCYHRYGHHKCNMKTSIRHTDHSHRSRFIKFNISPAISCCDTVATCHSSDDAVMRTSEDQRSVIVVDIVWSWTVGELIIKRTLLAFKTMNAISPAVSVLALPYRYGITLGAVKKGTAHLAVELCQFRSRAILMWI